jgi:hypothetical protein
MRQRRFLNASRNAGFVATVSARALIVLHPTLGLWPQRDQAPMQHGQLALLGGWTVVVRRRAAGVAAEAFLWGTYAASRGVGVGFEPRPARKYQKSRYTSAGLPGHCSIVGMGIPAMW